MKKVKKSLMLACVAGLVFVSSVKAQDKVEVSAGADIVSSYIWRGLNLGSAAVQPGISVSWKGLTLGAWGSTALTSFATDEFDLYLSYEIGGFSVTVTDYAFPTTLIVPELPEEPYLPEYFDYSSHVFEATLAYSFGEKLPLSIAWNTNFSGDDKHSSYAEIGYSVAVGNLSCDFALGLTPWKGAYSDDFALTNLSIKVSKEIAITDKFSLPVFTRAILNPDAKAAFLVFGISF